MDKNGTDREVLNLSNFTHLNILVSGTYPYFIVCESLRTLRLILWLRKNILAHFLRKYYSPKQRVDNRRDFSDRECCVGFACCKEDAVCVGRAGSSSRTAARPAVHQRNLRVQCRYCTSSIHARPIKTQHIYRFTDTFF